MTKFNGRVISGFACLLAFAAIGIAFIMQYVFLLEPCPLCIVQRIIVAMIGVLFAVDFFWGDKRILGFINLCGILVFCALGMFVAGRHVWLQHLPEDQIPACLPGLNYLLDTFPLYEVLAKVLKGTADCADEEWTFLGLSIPAQVFILFIIFFTIAVVRMVIKVKCRNIVAESCGPRALKF